MRVRGLVLSLLLLLSTSALVSTAGPAGAACTSGSKVIGGAFIGEDGRSVSGFVGLSVHDAQGRAIGEDGCPVAVGGYRSFIDLVNPHPSNPGCCFALPTGGDPSGGGERTWRITVPNNADSVWVEAYPKSSTPSDFNGQPHQTDYRRYGGALRNAAAAGTGIDVVLPLNCASGGQGSTLVGTATRNGAPATISTVVAFPRAVEGTVPIRGFVTTPYVVNGSTFTLPSLAPNQAYALEITTTDGGHWWFEHDYGSGVYVGACQTVRRNFELQPDGYAVMTSSITSGPSAAITPGYPNQVFFRGGDGALWSMYENGPAASLGGFMLGEPDATARGNRVDVVARGGDGAIWWRRLDGAWGPWISLGGSTPYPPSITSWGPGRLDVVATGNDGQLWIQSSNNGGASWSGWTALGGHLTAGPDISSWGVGRLDIVAWGGDWAGWHRYWQGAWSAWESLGGSLNGGPSATSAAANRYEVVAQGLDGRLFTMRWNGSNWVYWTSLLDGRTDADPDVTSYNGRVLVYARGLDGAVWRAMRLSPDSAYQGWGSVGG